MVEYFSLREDEDAVLGSSDYTAAVDGYTFQFLNDKNRKIFEKDPTAYLPQV